MAERGLSRRSGTNMSRHSTRVGQTFVYTSVPTRISFCASTFEKLRPHKNNIPSHATEHSKLYCQNRISSCIFHRTYGALVSAEVAGVPPPVLGGHDGLALVSSSSSSSVGAPSPSGRPTVLCLLLDACGTSMKVEKRTKEGEGGKEERSGKP